jgi:hypothetical protein
MLTSGPQKKHTLLAVEFLYKSVFLMAAPVRDNLFVELCRFAPPRSRNPAAQLGQGCLSACEHAQAGRPEGRLGCGCSPHRRALRSRCPPAIGGPVRGACGPPHLFPPLRGRAPPWPLARPGPRKQPRPCQKAVYRILCSRHRPLPVANEAGNRSARSPQREANPLCAAARSHCRK